MINLGIDFTFSKYQDICFQLKRSNYHTLRVRDWLELPYHLLKEPYVILRHDVDRFTSRALSIAEIEANNSIFSTYYFRLPNTWNPQIISKIERMGHEVGFHYECLDKACGDLEKAKLYFKEEVGLFKSNFELKTIAMHGNPFTNFDNRDLIKSVNLNKYDIIGEAYLSIDFSKMMYFTDTGRTWGSTILNIKDHVPNDQQSIKNNQNIKSTKDLIKLLSKRESNIYINTHPERWSNCILSWVIFWLKDFLVNILKYLVRKFYL